MDGTDDGLGATSKRACLGRSGSLPALPYRLHACRVLPMCVVRTLVQGKPRLLVAFNVFHVGYLTYNVSHSMFPSPRCACYTVVTVHW